MKTQTNDFTYLGRGTFGEVYKHQSTAIKVAKLLSIKKHNHREQHIVIDNTLREAIFYSLINDAGNDANITTHCLRPLPPSSIPRASVYLDKEDKLILKMPYYGEPLSKVTIPTKSHLLHLMKQLLSALHWLHAQGWSHGDIKPSN
ncbi:protein kinase family protein, partial [bacterium]|nr:protein kinase family protein [bacterium]